LNDKLFRNSL